MSVGQPWRRAPRAPATWLRARSRKAVWASFESEGSREMVCDMKIAEGEPKADESGAVGFASNDLAITVSRSSLLSVLELRPGRAEKEKITRC